MKNLAVLAVVAFALLLPQASLAQTEACRSAGYWGTHAGTAVNTPKVYNVTSLVIASVGQLLICGQAVTPHTDANNVDSASSPVEALCAAPAGDIRLQLNRQLTAAALNCAANGLNADCSNSGLYASVFAACNNPAVCATGSREQMTACIGALDCLNEGGIPGPGGFCGTGSCSDNGAACAGDSKQLCGDPTTANCEPVHSCHLLSFAAYPDSPAGSAKACNRAEKSECSPFTSPTNCSLP